MTYDTIEIFLDGVPLKMAALGTYPPQYGYPYPPSTMPPAPPPKPTQPLGTKRKDAACKKCANKGHIVLSFADDVERVWTCKLCGKEEIEKR